MKIFFIVAGYFIAGIFCALYFIKKDYEHSKWKNANDYIEYEEDSLFISAFIFALWPFAILFYVLYLAFFNTIKYICEDKEKKEEQ